MNEPTFRKFKLRRWKKVELNAANLDFRFMRDWPVWEAMKVWYWELDRELGTEDTPFVTHAMSIGARINQGDERKSAELDDWFRSKSDGFAIHKNPEEARAYRMVRQHHISLPPGVKYRKMSELLGRSRPPASFKAWADFLRAPGPYSTIHAFEIDWSQPVARIVAAFKYWVEHQETHARRGWRLSASFNLRGRGDICFAWLGDLALYRVSSARFSRTQGLNVLEKFGITKTPISSPNWAHAKRRSRERIKRYKFIVEHMPNGNKVEPDSPLAWSLLRDFGRVVRK